MFISLIVPCYNEASRGVGSSYSLFSRLERIRTDLVVINHSFEVIFVDDGSTDKTFDEILNYIDTHHMEDWVVTKHISNFGKGCAIRTGIVCAKGEYIAYADADLSTSLIYLNDIDFDENTCYIASRFAKGSKIVNRRPWGRRVVSRISRLLLSFLFGLNVSDTQCGFKVFPADTLKSAEKLLEDSRWLMDIEILYAMKVHGVAIKEVPVVWNNIENESTLNLSSGLIDSLSDLSTILRHKNYIRRCFKK